MMTAYFAIDRQTMENGCIKLLKGSNKLGRIDHVAIGDQQGADPERVELALKRFEEVFFVAEPGDAVRAWSPPVSRLLPAAIDTKRVS